MSLVEEGALAPVSKPLHRRGFLQVGGLVAVAVLAGCGEDAPVRRSEDRVPYGDGPEQFAELYRPHDGSRGVVVVIHGGFWKAEYDRTLGRPLATALADAGWTAWNIEYRRVGNGGGAPGTFDDVGAAIDALADVEGLDTSTVVTLGHSAGGHLAVWAAARRSPRVTVTHAISQAGVLDLRSAHAAGLGSGAVEAFLGHPPDAGDAAYDPIRQVPLDAPVWCVHGRDDDIVPISQSVDYVAAATEAGGRAELVEVDGDHFVVIDTGSGAWSRTLRILDGIG